MVQLLSAQERRAIRFGLRAVGAWLVPMGIFAAMLWLSGWGKQKPSTEEEKPLEADAPLEDPPALDPGPTIGCTLGLPDPHPLERYPLDPDPPPFGATMTRPVLISGEQLQYTREALEARVQGLMIVKCVITREGEVQDCRIIKGLPHMNDAALAALESRRYTPVQYQGNPIAVSYVFNVKLTLPQP